MKQPKQKKELTWVLKRAKPVLPGLAVLSAGDAVSAAIAGSFALVIKQVVDNAACGNFAAFVRAAVLYLVLLLVRTGLMLGLNLLREKFSFQLTRRLQESVYRTLLCMDYSRFSGYHSGALLSHITADTETVANAVMNILPGVLSLLVTLVGAAGVLVIWDARFSALLLGGGVVVFICVSLLRRKMKRLQRRVREENDKNWSFYQESFHNMMILRAFSAQKMMERRLDERMEQMRHARFRQVAFSELCNKGFYLGVNGSYLLGLVWCSVGLLRGTLTYGTLSAVLELVVQLQTPITQFSSYIPQYYAMCASAERLMALEAQPAEAVRQPDAAKDEALYANLAAICAKDLTFAYDDRPVYAHADLQIRKGETVAFMGRSGIGKSTFLKLLLALYQPSGGEIWLQSTDGTRTPISVNTRGLFAYVPQENGLLSGSIWECVALFRNAQELTEEEKARVRQACRTACAEEFILALPQGYDTPLGENGKGLSEGQMQRLAVARALYTQAPILLLDEATSALDEATETRLLQNLQADAGQKTVLIVTHRRAALALCSQVFEVKNGTLQKKINV